MARHTTCCHMGTIAARLLAAPGCRCRHYGSVGVANRGLANRCALQRVGRPRGIWPCSTQGNRKQTRRAHIDHARTVPGPGARFAVGHELHGVFSRPPSRAAAFVGKARPDACPPCVAGLSRRGGRLAFSPLPSAAQVPAPLDPSCLRLPTRHAWCVGCVCCCCHFAAPFRGAARETTLLVEQGGETVSW